MPNIHPEPPLEEPGGKSMAALCHVSPVSMFRDFMCRVYINQIKFHALEEASTKLAAAFRASLGGK